MSPDQTCTFCAMTLYYVITGPGLVKSRVTELLSDWRAAPIAKAKPAGIVYDKQPSGLRLCSTAPRWQVLPKFWMPLTSRVSPWLAMCLQETCRCDFLGSHGKLKPGFQSVQRLVTPSIYQTRILSLVSKKMHRSAQLLEVESCPCFPTVSILSTSLHWKQLWLDPWPVKK